MLYGGIGDTVMVYEELLRNENNIDVVFASKTPSETLSALNYSGKIIPFKFIVSDSISAKILYAFFIFKLYILLKTLGVKKAYFCSFSRIWKYLPLLNVKSFEARHKTLPRYLAISELIRS